MHWKYIGLFYSNYYRIWLEAGSRLTSKFRPPTSNHKISRKESLALKCIPAGKGRVFTNE
jgi:hypothetical protein